MLQKELDIREIAERLQDPLDGEHLVVYDGTSEIRSEHYGQVVTLDLYKGSGGGIAYVFEHLMTPTVVPVTPQGRRIIQENIARGASRAIYDWQRQIECREPLRVLNRSINAGELIFDRYGEYVLFAVKRYDRYTNKDWPEEPSYALDCPAGSSNQIEKIDLTHTSLREVMAEECLVFIENHDGFKIVMPDDDEEFQYVRRKLLDHYKEAVECGLYIDPRLDIAIQSLLINGKDSKMVRRQRPSLPMKLDGVLPLTHVDVCHRDGEHKRTSRVVFVGHDEGSDILRPMTLPIELSEFGRMKTVDLETLHDSKEECRVPLNRKHVWLKVSDLPAYMRGDEINGICISQKSADGIKINRKKYPFKSLARGVVDMLLENVIAQ